MSIGEVSRRVASYNRVKIDNMKEKASFDYLLANTIASLMGHVLGDKGEPPKIEDIYPTLFKEQKTEEEQVQETAKKDITKVLAFAAQFNKRFEGGQSKE